MKIELKEISIRELAEGYQDNSEGGVTGYGGKLDIRPPYQREFIYKTKQRDAVIDTVMKGFPLNVMYWAVREDGCFEVIDGQQRTISLCQYLNGDFAFDMKYIHNLPADKREQILNYKLMVYLCEGSDSEKLSWFETINIAGAKLTKQELLNATYHGPFVSDAKRYFSKTGGPAYGLASNYINGSPIRQDYLETALNWLSKGNVQVYMANHQHEQNANELWLYFQSVINWVKLTFIKYRKEMKGVNWGLLYNKYKNEKFDTAALEKEISVLMEDEDVTDKKGVYDYVLTGNERSLNLRLFSDKIKRQTYEKQKGICVKCGGKFTLSEMEADHITPWSKGGHTTAENCQMLCKDCNRRKSAI
ncbi:HNH endonuclease family protein [Candidatus Proelusimicrobium excrementi]|uniref:HNH endonuclease family protein n=1 Tax=Candidatus Proelusimicrobium excrementi TaxID=3416222 RepID=UPI003D0A0B38